MWVVICSHLIHFLSFPVRTEAFTARIQALVPLVFPPTMDLESCLSDLPILAEWTQYSRNGSYSHRAGNTREERPSAIKTPVSLFRVCFRREHACFAYVGSLAVRARYCFRRLHE